MTATPPDGPDRSAIAPGPGIDDLPDLVVRRRSVRAFAAGAVPRERLVHLVAAAGLAPAPHHSRPWRFAIVDTPEARDHLARSMGEAWARDLYADGVDPQSIERLTAASRARLGAAPALVLASLTEEGLNSYPDERRRRAEWGLAMLSLGAAVENLLLTATHLGLAACWIAAPMFCPETARDALRLPGSWTPQALVAVGYPDPAYRPPSRPDLETESFIAWR